MDLEVARDHDLPSQAKVLERLHADLERIGLPITVFTTGEAANTALPGETARRAVRARAVPAAES